jgi:murein DD-endopeptidase MepM/ murein hydrolase activator NlpD
LFPFRSIAQAALTKPDPAVAPGKVNTTGPQNYTVTLPDFKQFEAVQAIPRLVNLHTIIPTRPRQEISTYTVQVGDSVFQIATQFNIKPETVLWANYDLLNDNPDLISLGMELKIPPANGVYYQWQEGDTIETVAARFKAKAEDILNWSGNNLDLTDPKVEPGAWILVPDGEREFRQWIIPTIPRGRAGVSSSLYGAGTCAGGYEGAYGTGAFVWPAGNHSLSGNDYWSGHLGIDIAAGEGAPIYAADSGVVVFSGWATGGYGYMVMIDHGNGYQTVYAHLSQASASCGRSVIQGGTIGYSGSSGNSTGAHLHFEVRYQGGFVSPWYVLPSP